MPGANDHDHDDDTLPDLNEDGAKKGPPADDATAADAAAAALAATEASAAKKGWVPKDEFDGDPAKWVDAATFVERGNNFNKTLQNKVAKLEAELSSFKGTAEAFKKFHKDAMEGKQREIDAALKQIKKDHREAIRDGDDETADALEGRMDALNADKAAVVKSLEEPPEQKTESAQTPELKAWVKDGNEWFMTDLKMQRYALDTAQELLANGETLRGRPFLDKVAVIIREDFPSKFKNPLRNRASAAESGTPADATKPGRSAKDLPEEDRALMKQFVKEGWTTEKKFLDEYRW